MQNLIILGAGASYGCSWAQNGNRPPLLSDLFSIVTKANRLYINPDMELANEFDNLYKSLEISDFEVYCTTLYYIEKIRRDLEPKNVFFTNGTLDYILLNKKIIEKYIPDKFYSDMAYKILVYSSKHRKLASMYIAYINFLTLFSRNLYDYFYSLHWGHIHCNYLERLFKYLDENDTVVSFNYDEIADYTLLDMGKIALSSFDGLGFSGVHIPESLMGNKPVKLLKVHGSFNWYSEPVSLSYYLEKIYYNLPVKELDEKIIGSTPTRLVFPLKYKENLYSSNTVLHLHQKAFESALNNSEQIWLVGKNFMNNDVELATRIQNSCTSSKTLNIIDPSVNDMKFVEFHLNLFNAKKGEFRKSLYDFYSNPF